MCLAILGRLGSEALERMPVESLVCVVWSLAALRNAHLVLY